MVDKVFHITGNKIASFITDENSLKFSSQRFDTIEEFQKAWNKKLTLNTKVEIKYDSIKSIKKEDNDKDILIKYKTFVGIPSDCEFVFVNNDDYETFFTFLANERYFTKRHETLTPFKAIRNYLIGLIITIGCTIVAYYQALDIANGTVEEAHDYKTRLFNNIVGMLGDKGVIATGALIAAYLLYKMWSRYSNPPDQMILLPPNK